jgi:DNA-directed RNA polymerase specialized sigma24 family protein
MILNAPATNTDETFDLSSDNTFEKLYPSLESLAKYFVYSLRVPSWQGQENDIVADIVQETWRRVIERSRKAERGEAPPIRSLKSIVTVIARNYCKDLRRHDRKLLRILPQDVSPQAHLSVHDQQHLEDAGSESVYQEKLFKLVAREIASFPEKQRIAILTDLANRMYFEKQPTPLQLAFLKVGLDLRDYRKTLPTDPKERSRHVSLVTYAYKRVTSLMSVQQYIAFG